MKYSYVFVCLFALLWGCDSSGNQGGATLDSCPKVATLHTVDGEPVVVADLNLFKKDVQTIPLSELVEDFQIIKLDGRPEALVQGGMTFVSDKYIGFGARFGIKMPYKVFDRQGNYLSAIGSIGQGPGEYVNMYDSYIDDKNGHVYILPWNSKQLLKYDIEGNFSASIPLAYRVPKGVFQVDGDKKRVYVGIIPFENYGSDAVYWEQDFQGDVIHKVEPGHFYVAPDFSNEITSQGNTTEKDLYIFYWGTRQDSLYHYDDVQKKLKPVFTLDFKGDLLMHDYGELPGYYLANITTEINQVAGGFQAEKPAYELIIDKNTQKGTFYELVNDYLGNMPIVYPMSYFSNGYFLMNMDPGDLHEQLEKHLESNAKLKDQDRDYLTKLYNSISIENDNNYLLIAKLKTKPHKIQFQSEKMNISESSVSLPEEEMTALQVEPFVIDEDTTIYDVPYYSAYLTTWKTYFPANNRFKDWPKSDEKMVLIRAIVEKSGKATNVTVHRSCDVAELDAEAIRLIEEAPIDPARDKDGTILRSKFTVQVFFPPR